MNLQLHLYGGIIEEDPRCGRKIRKSTVCQYFIRSRKKLGQFTGISGPWEAKRVTISHNTQCYITLTWQPAVCIASQHDTFHYNPSPQLGADRSAHNSATIPKIERLKSCIYHIPQSQSQHLYVSWPRACIFGIVLLDQRHEVRSTGFWGWCNLKKAWCKAGYLEDRGLVGEEHLEPPESLYLHFSYGFESRKRELCLE